MPRSATVCSWTFLLSALLVLCCGTAATAGSNDSGSVFLTDGTVYQHVLFKYERQFLILKIYVGPEEKPLSLHLIARIENESGEDITHKVTGRNSVPVAASPQPTAPSDSTQQPNDVAASAAPDSAQPPDNLTPSPAAETPPAATNAPVWTSREDFTKVQRRRSTWTIGLEIGPQLGVPLADYYDGMGAGLGFDGCLRFPFNRHLAFRAIVSRFAPSSDFDNISLAIWRYSGAFEYYTSLTKGDRPTRTWFYGYTGLGATSTSGSSGPFSYSETKFTVPNGLGFIFMLSPSMGLDVGLNFDILFIGTSDRYDGYDPYGNVQTAAVFGLRIALSFMAPRHSESL